MKLRPFNVNDLDSFVKYHSDLESMQYQELIRIKPKTIYNILFKNIDSEDRNKLALVLKDTDKLISNLYLHTVDSKICLGYSFNKIYLKHEYINEILKEVIKCCIESRYVICALVEKENIVLPRY